MKPFPKHTADSKAFSVEDLPSPAGLPVEGFVRLDSILHVIPVGRSTWWAGVKDGQFPRPIRIPGSRVTMWRVEDIRALIKALSEGQQP